MLGLRSRLCYELRAPSRDDCPWGDDVAVGLGRRNRGNLVSVASSQVFWSRYSRRGSLALIVRLLLFAQCVILLVLTSGGGRPVDCSLLILSAWRQLVKGRGDSEAAHGGNAAVMVAN